MSDASMPPGWPQTVAPPGTADWEVTAVSWLVDQVPHLRGHPVQSQPVVLASIVSRVVAGAAEGARAGYRTVRTDLGDAVEPHVVDVALSAYQLEGSRLAAAARAAGLVARALRGEPLRSLHRPASSPRA